MNISKLNHAELVSLSKKADKLLKSREKEFVKFIEATNLEMIEEIMSFWQLESFMDKFFKSSAFDFSQPATCRFVVAILQHIKPLCSDGQYDLYYRQVVDKARIGVVDMSQLDDVMQDMPCDMLRDVFSHQASINACLNSSPEVIVQGVNKGLITTAQKNDYQRKFIHEYHEHGVESWRQFIDCFSHDIRHYSSENKKKMTHQLWNLKDEMLLEDFFAIANTSLQEQLPLYWIDEQKGFFSQFLNYANQVLPGSDGFIRYVASNHPLRPQVLQEVLNEVKTYQPWEHKAQVFLRAYVQDAPRLQELKILSDKVKDEEIKSFVVQTLENIDLNLQLQQSLAFNERSLPRSKI